LQFGGVFDPDTGKKRISELEQITNSPDFWNDKTKAEAIFSELNKLKDELTPWEDLIKKIEEIYDLIELYEEEDDSEIYQEEIENTIQTTFKEYDSLKIKTLLDGKYDKSDCFLTIHAGAGGTEACDWTQMLLRLYLRWCERHNYKTQILDELDDEGGIRNVTVQVKGPYAFGYLKSETGVHRLVRISPFDSNARRHTTFSSVYISPVVDESINIEIKSDDYRLDTYRSGGAGGQHVNKTDSAVRITHFESGIVVQCQNERSQIMNREIAWKMLRSRLYEYYKAKKDKEHQDEAAEKRDISWGSQIRSYVFQPYTLVKDLRTGESVGNISAVMDGDIDNFIQSYLEWSQGEK